MPYSCASQRDDITVTIVIEIDNRGVEVRLQRLHRVPLRRLRPQLLLARAQQSRQLQVQR
jgi:hypothetical protein